MKHNDNFFLQILGLMEELILVCKGQGGISILTMFNAIEVRVILKSVHPVMLDIMTVAIQRMLGSAVKVCVWISIIILHFREKHNYGYMYMFLHSYKY